MSVDPSVAGLNEPQFMSLDLNKLSKEELDKVKSVMNADFELHRLQPGDEGYKYDVQENFGPASEVNSWDSENSLEGPSPHAARGISPLGSSPTGVPVKPTTQEMHSTIVSRSPENTKSCLSHYPVRTHGMATLELPSSSPVKEQSPRPNQRARAVNDSHELIIEDDICIRKPSRDSCGNEDSIPDTHQELEMIPNTWEDDWLAAHEVITGIFKKQKELLHEREIRLRQIDMFLRAENNGSEATLNSRAGASDIHTSRLERLIHTRRFLNTLVHA